MVQKDRKEVMTCDFENCDNQALCESANLKGALVCSYHFKLINNVDSDSAGHCLEKQFARAFLNAMNRKYGQ